ncbi:MAG: leucine-rich repeat protein, partial [Muribaculaceae bacterium]|nr:leucine-rich repeat protein [Muribaculaceae bacterium]
SHVEVGAYDVVVGGLPYTLDKEHGTASVVRGECGYIFPTSQLSGAISIPSSITYEGTTYTVTSVNRQAFRNNTAITSVTIPETVTALSGVIAGYAGNESDTDVYRRSGSQFEGCTALTSVRLSSKIKIIPIRCFYNTPISQIELPYGLQEIGYQAFSGTNITSLTIPSSITKLHRALGGMTKLQHLYYNRTDPDGLFLNWGQLEIETGYVPSGFNLYVPVGYVQQFKNNSRVTSKAASVQAGAYDIYCNSKYFTVNSDGQTSKLVYSPAYATGLSQVNINQICYDGWTRIYNCVALGDSCFAGSNVQAVQIATDFPSKVIPRYAFMNCTRLNNIGFITSHGVTELGESAFQNCTALSGTIILPETLQMIGRRAFVDCNNIAAIYTHDETWEDDALYVGTSIPRTIIYVPMSKLAERLTLMSNWHSKAGNTEYFTHPYLRNTGGPQLISCPEHLSMNAACDFYAITGYDATRKVFTTQKVNGNVFRNCGKESGGRGVLVDNLASDYVPLKVAKITSEIESAQSWTDVTNLILPMTEGGNLTGNTSYSFYTLDGANKRFDRITSFPHAFDVAEAYVRVAKTVAGTTNPVGLDLYYTSESIVGDVDGDGKVDVTDVNAVINIILKTKTAADYQGNADVDGDGKVDVADVNAVINIILKVS